MSDYAEHPHTPPVYGLRPVEATEPASSQEPAEAPFCAQKAGLPDIIVRSQQLRELTDEVLASLEVHEAAHPSLFVRSAKIVRVVEDEKGRPLLLPVGDAELRGLLTRSANYYRARAKDGEIRLLPIHPPQTVVRDILSLDPARWPFRPLIALIEAPTLRPDGTVIDTPGYDPATRLYYHPARALRHCQIPEHPTEQEVGAALARIWDSFREFSYLEPADQANALAALLTPLLRPAIARHIPLAVITAPKQGSGKGLLVDGISMIATGRPALVQPAPGSEEEWDKRITALLLEGHPLITLDNVVGRLQSEKLEAVLTSEMYGGRPLGTSTIVPLPNRATWMATGNNLKVGGDLARRCYQIRLDPRVSRPWMREGFAHADLITHLAETRAEHIAALLTLARAWFVAGKPLDPALPHLGTFTPWVQTIGGILRHVGVPGFLQNLDTLYGEADEEETQWEAFLLTWATLFGPRWIEVAHLVGLGKQEQRATLFSAASSEHQLLAALPAELLQVWEEKPKSFAICLGKALEKRVGACYGADNLHIERRDDRHTKKRMWRVMAGSAGSVSVRSTPVYGSPAPLPAPAVSAWHLCDATAKEGGAAPPASDS
jgi:hypothetical protein